MNNYQAALWQIAKVGGQATPSFLRYIKAVPADNSEIKFDLKTINENEGNSFENRLDQSQAFVVTHLGFSFLVAASEAAQQTAEKHTFPNDNVFSTNVEALYAIYNGKLNYTVGQNQALQAFEMNRFMFKPITQKLVGQVATAAGSDSTSPVADAGNQFAGFVDLNPAVVILDAGHKMTMNIQFESQGSVPANTYIVMTARGYAVTNGAGMTKDRRWTAIKNIIKNQI